MKLARNNRLEAFVEQFAADRRDAVGRRRPDLGLLQRVVETLSFGLADLQRRRACRDVRHLTDLASHRRGHARERVRQERGDGRTLLGPEHRDQSTELDPIRMGLDLLGLLGQHGRGPRYGSFFTIGTLPMNRHVGIGDRRLLEILIDTAATSFVDGRQFDRNAGPRLDLRPGLILDETRFDGLAR